MKKRGKNASPKAVRMRNLLLLVLTFSLGQGGLLLASTALALTGNLELLGNLGSTLMILSLLILLIDYGSTMTLCKQVKAIKEPHILWRKYTGTVAARLTSYLMVTIIVVVVVRCMLGFNSFFFTAYISFAPFAIMWAFNLSGIFDAINKSGVNSLFLLIPFALSAALYFACSIKTIEPKTAAHFLGVLFGGGYAFAVLLQHLFLARRRLAPSVSLISVKEYLQSLRYGFGVLLVSLAGVINGRIQVAMGAMFLSPEKLGIFILIRQVLNGLNLSVSYVRKVMLPYSINTLLSKRESLLQHILTNRLSIYFAAIITCVSAFTSHALQFIGDQGVSQIVIYFTPFSLLIVTSSLSGLYFQYYQIKENLLFVNLINFLAVAISSWVAYEIIEEYEIYSFFIASVLMFLMQTTFAALISSSVCAQKLSFRL